MNKPLSAIQKTFGDFSGGHSEQLPFHLKHAVENGVNGDELVAAITHSAFYAGWPRAMSALAVAKETFKPQP